MPIYEYECKDCGQASEMLVRSSEEGVVCPSCGSSSLKKMFSTFAVSMAAESAEHACSERSCPLPSSSPCASGRCPL